MVDFKRFYGTLVLGGHQKSENITPVCIENYMGSVGIVFQFLLTSLNSAPGPEVSLVDVALRISILFSS